MPEIRDLAVIIPTLDPDGTLCRIAGELHDAGFQEIIIVDDGSCNGESEAVFRELETHSWCHLLHHQRNRGKGAALKTAFMDYLSRHSGGAGCITTDDDGQHTVQDIIRVAEAFCREPETLHLGCRNFSGVNVPWKSRIGNNLTRSIFRFLAGITVADTQTGLRAIPAYVMELSLAIRGDRFEFETAMLLRAWDKNIRFNEITIETVYVAGNAGTHFHPLKDAALIYRVIFLHILRQLFRFLLSSMSSALIDFSVFAFLVGALTLDKERMALPLLMVCAAARVTSATWNFLVNRYWVFATDPGKRTPLGGSLLKYAGLCVGIFSASYGLTFLLAHYVQKSSLQYWKLLIDIILFLISFVIQKAIVFRKKR